MKIGIVTSGTEMLGLFKKLNQFDHEYVICYDFLYWPYGDKGFEFGLERIKYWVDVLEKKGVDKIILPPIYEAFFDEEGKMKNKGGGKIMSMFKNYLLNHCFAGSLVGKIGFIGDYTDIGVGQKILQSIEKKYSLSDKQKNTKKFPEKFSYRGKEVSSWKYFLQTFSYSNYMVNKQVKMDLRYFKDANVDTIIPLNYGYFNLEKTITGFFNQNKTKFHDLDKLLDGFKKLSQSEYSVTILANGHTKILEREKRIMWLLERGETVKLIVNSE